MIKHQCSVDRPVCGCFQLAQFGWMRRLDSLRYTHCSVEFTRRPVGGTADGRNFRA